MELSTFSENIVTEVLTRNGESVELKLNIDALVPEYFAVLEERLKPLADKLTALAVKIEAVQKGKKDKKLPSVISLEKEMTELQREVFAERLTCPVQLPDGSWTALLKDWSIVENGQPIKPTREALLRLPPRLVAELWNRAFRLTQTVKKTDGEEETLAAMQGGSLDSNVIALRS